MAINEITSIDVKTLPPFKRLIMTLGELPTSYLESMTYAELLMWFCNFLQEKVLPAINNNADALQDVITYLENLDLQDEVDHKLDEMVETGTLQEIIAEYLNANALWCYDNVEEMKQATNFIEGSYARTLGYYNANDGGASLYKIRKIEESDTIDEMLLIALSDDTLVAELVIPSELKAEALGAKGDGTTDDTSKINKLLGIEGITAILEKTYLLTSNVSINNNVEIKGNGTLKLTGGVGATTASGYIHADDKSNINVHDITVDNQCTTLLNDKTITFKNCSNVIVDNCRILNKGNRTGWTLVFWNCTYSKITNNYIKGSDSYQLDDGIHVTGHDILIDGNYVETIDDAIAIGYNSISSTGGIQPTSSTVSKNINITNNNIKSTEAGIHLYTYSNETSIENVTINNVNMDGRIIIRDDVSNETSITIKKVVISNCNINDVSHSGNSAIFVLGNNKEILIDSCNLESAKGTGIFVAERVGSDVLINNCDIKYTQENPQYRSIINFGSVTSNMDVIIQNCKITTNCRLIQGSYNSLKIYNNYFLNTQTDTTAYGVITLSGLGDNGVQVTGNTFITTATNVLSVGSLTSKKFVFAFNTTNVSNPTYEAQATDFHTNYNMII